MIVWSRAIYVACIVYLSARTMLSATRIADHHFWLGGAEIIGALLLLFARTRRTGLVVLLIVYAIAATHEALGRHFPATLIIYAVAALMAGRG